jgi:hypothetical protein
VALLFIPFEEALKLVEIHAARFVRLRWQWWQLELRTNLSWQILIPDKFHANDPHGA